MDKSLMKRMLAKGIIFDKALNMITKENRARLAADAAITDPNANIPALFTSYVDSRIIKILLAPRNAKRILPEVKKGDWTNDYAVFRTVENTGTITPYSDYGNGASSDVNVTFPTRQQYIGQTTIRYGELEEARLGLARIDLISQKQISAATVIEAATNKIDLLGVEGMSIYGLINDPNIPAALTPATVNSDQTAWADKTTTQIYDDILSLYKQIISASNGLVSPNDEFVLAVSPTASVELGKATDFNVSVKDMIDRYAPNTDMVILPELASTESGDSVMLIAKSVMGMPTGELGYGEKMRALRIVPKSSYYEQKFAFGTYGCILYYPFAVAKMTGVTAVD